MQKNRMQILNPKTKHWVKIDTKCGGIVGHKHDTLPYRNVMTSEQHTVAMIRQKEVDNYVATHSIKINAKYARLKIKCDCGHFAREHYLREGACDACGCTWYSPNGHWIRKQQQEAARAFLVGQAR